MLFDLSIQLRRVSVESKKLSDKIIVWSFNALYLLNLAPGVSFVRIHDGLELGYQKWN